MARRNKLFGLWAAGQLGHSGAEAEPTPRRVCGRFRGGGRRRRAPQGP
jgi:hypothetical protein